MASASGVLSEDQFSCSICLDVFSEPVTIPCGHTFCKTCITNYWDQNSPSKCPLCKKTFKRRPDVFVNVIMSELAAQFRNSPKKEPVRSQVQRSVQSGEVSCDVCVGRKQMAVKSCLVCLASYCVTHLEPHNISLALRKHRLIDPVGNLEDRVCEKHGKPLEMFCRTDGTCVCHLCLEKTHENHNIVPLERESRERRGQIQVERTGLLQGIQERVLKVQEMKQSVGISESEARREKADAAGVFAALVTSIQSCQSELMEIIEEKQRVAEKQAVGFVRELQQEISELERRSSELEKLLGTEDHLHLLRSFPALGPPPPTKDWSQISVLNDVSVQAAVKAVAQLEEILRKDMERFPEVMLKRIRHHAVDVTLDPDTANPELILSEDGKQVHHGDERKKLPDNPKRFDFVVRVLGMQGFATGRFYFEVGVKGKTKWDLGVARESVKRRGNVTSNTANGFWSIFLRDEDNYWSSIDPLIPLFLKTKPQTVGVFVDYEEGDVSFFDVEARILIYSFSGYTFTEKLYPYFNPCLNDGGANSAPLVICPLKQDD